MIPVLCAKNLISSNRIQADLGRPVPSAKNISLRRLTQITCIFAHPVPHEGRLAIVTDVGAGCGGRGRRFMTNGAEPADGEVVWS